jgi:hypothetical protein
VFNRKPLSWLLITLVFLTGCGANGSENANTAADSKLTASEAAWIEACESDYKSSDCRTKDEKYVSELIPGQNLYAYINPYTDYEKSSECITDPKGTACKTLRLFADSQIADLTCGEVEAFGSGYFCWGQILMRNIGTSPIDDYVEASLFDADGSEFAADVTGSFTVGVAPLDFGMTSVQLNPEKAKFFQFGFSVPDIKRQYRSIMLSGSDVYLNIILCRKNSGDLRKMSKNDQEKTAIYEDASLLNSCKFDQGKFINRLDGSVS